MSPTFIYGYYVFFLLSELKWHHCRHHQLDFHLVCSEPTHCCHLLLHHCAIHPLGLLRYLLRTATQCKPIQWHVFNQKSLFWFSEILQYLDLLRWPYKIIKIYGKMVINSTNETFQRFYRYHDHIYHRALQEKKKQMVVHALPHWTILKQCLPQCFNVFFTYFVTLTIFPSVYAGNITNRL